jgi:hypothetical protein
VRTSWWSAASSSSASGLSIFLALTSTVALKPFTTCFGGAPLGGGNGSSPAPLLDLPPVSIADAGPSPEYSRPLKPPARHPPAPAPRASVVGAGVGRWPLRRAHDARHQPIRWGQARTCCLLQQQLLALRCKKPRLLRACLDQRRRAPPCYPPTCPSTPHRRHASAAQPKSRQVAALRWVGRRAGRTVAWTLAGVMPVLPTHSAVDPGRALTCHVPPLPTAVCTRAPVSVPGRNEHERRALRRATCDGSSTPPGHALVANLCPLLLAHAIACRLVVVQVPCSRMWGYQQL